MKSFLSRNRSRAWRVQAHALWFAITLIAEVTALAQNASTDYERLGRDVRMSGSW